MRRLDSAALDGLANRLYASTVGTANDIGFTSAQSREGVSTIVWNIAGIFAKTHGLSVAVVDLNLQHPSQARAFKVANAPGLTDAVLGNQMFHECIIRSESGVHVMPVGRTAGSGLALLDAPRLGELMDWLRANYRVVIFDCPAVETSSGTALFAARLSGIVLVVASERTRGGAVRHTRDLLEAADARVLGVVLNDYIRYLPKWIYRWF